MPPSKKRLLIEQLRKITAKALRDKERQQRKHVAEIEQVKRKRVVAAPKIRKRRDRKGKRKVATRKTPKLSAAAKSWLRAERNLARHVVGLIPALALKESAIGNSHCTALYLQEGQYDWKKNEAFGAAKLVAFWCVRNDFLVEFLPEPPPGLGQLVIHWPSQ